MNTQEAYNNWAAQYDSNENKTRDLEARSLRQTLANMQFENCLEIGCGTGKNTVWLMQRTSTITAVDLSDKMLEKAKAKISSGKVKFVQANITKDWSFANKEYDLISFSLVLEHINDLYFIFEQASKLITGSGFIYVGELHPFKQYTGSKARFETSTGTQVVDCYIHHISDFTEAAKAFGLRLLYISEYFDNDNRNEIPRILSMLFTKVR